MESQRFITVFTAARHLSLSCARSIHSTLCAVIYLGIHFIITLPILSSSSGSSTWPLSYGFPHQKEKLRPHTLPFPRLQRHLIVLDMFGRIRHIAQLLTVWSCVTAPLSIIFLKTPRLCSSLNVGNQVSHPYRTTGKIIILCIFNLYVSS